MKEMKGRRRRRSGFGLPAFGDLSRMPPGKLLTLALVLLIVLAASWWETRNSPEKGEPLVASVVRVVDGDTLVVRTDSGKRKVRLLGVDTPETVHPTKEVQFFGPEASAFTKKALNGKTVWLEYDVAPLDRYQRHLAYVWLEEPKEGEEAIRRGMFNARLLLGGYARVMTIQPNVRHAELFLKFQKEAREAKRGLWKKAK